MRRRAKRLEPYEKTKARGRRPEDIRINFVGLFDTVEAFGVPLEELRGVINKWVWPISFDNKKIWRNVDVVRHALSLDDERRTFHPLRLEPENEDVARRNSDQIKEVWFAGVHSDVGGGYPDDTAALTPLLWMLDELKKTGKEGLKFRGDA